jgi:hypothetical protein
MDVCFETDAVASRRSGGRRRVELAKRLVELAWERGFSAKSGVVDLRLALRRLPLLVQCAVRVHDQREPRGARVFGLEGMPRRAGETWPYLVVAPHQRLVLLFSSRGALDAAGELVAAPAGPVEPGARWTSVRWASSPAERDWY